MLHSSDNHQDFANQQISKTPNNQAPILMRRPQVNYGALQQLQIPYSREWSDHSPAGGYYYRS
jgi:hypothetical protein